MKTVMPIAIFQKAVILLAILVLPFSAALSGRYSGGQYSGEYLENYSPLAVRSVAVAYLAGRLSVPVQKLKDEIEEIVINDQYGVSLYSVEIFLGSTVYTISFSGMEPIEIQ